MSSVLDFEKNKNIDKLVIGACLELSFLTDRFNSVFSDIKSFISSNSCFFNSQTEDVLINNFNSLNSLVCNNINIVLCDIDKSEKFCEFHSRYY